MKNQSATPIIKQSTATMSSDEHTVANKPPVKRVGGIKIVVRSKKKKTKSTGMMRSAQTSSLQTLSTRGFPKRAPQKTNVNVAPTSETVQQHQGEADFIMEEEGDIPCDTLFAIRSLEQSRQCLDVPLFRGTVPCVLESQLQERLKSENGDDSSVTKELQQLLQSNKVRRLMSAAESGENAVAAVMESRHYKRAVWDAHRHYGKSSSSITAGFLSCLEHVTKRRMSVSDLKQHWPETANTWNASILDTLIQMQVLLPVKDSYILWLPNWGLVLKQLSKAQSKVISQLKRSLYKELSKSQVERMHHTGLAGQFVLHTLCSQGLVELQERPSGTFVKLSKSI